MDIDAIVAALAKYVAAGGGIVAISFSVFKVLGTKWLDNKFSERLQHLKWEQDQAIRHVQSTIDREIHRAKKLYDNEFNALSECWRLLRRAFDLSAGTIASWTYQVDRYTDEELDRLLSKQEMEEWEQKHLKSLTGKDRLNYYERWSESRRYREIHAAWREFRLHLDTNSIFFPEGLAEKISVIDKMIVASNVEFQTRIEEIGAHSTTRTGFKENTKLRKEGEELMKELEGLVRNRLWSAAK